MREALAYPNSSKTGRRASENLRRRMRRLQGVLERSLIGQVKVRVEWANPDAHPKNWRSARVDGSTTIVHTDHTDYDRLTAYEQSDSSVQGREIRGIARYPKQASKRKDRWYRTHNTRDKQAKTWFGPIQLNEAINFHPSRDHASSVAQQHESDEDAIVARKRARTELKRDLSRVSDSQVDWVKHSKTTAVLFENPLDRQPLQDFIDQRPKNHHGFARSGQLQTIARPTAEALVEPETDKGKSVVSPARKLLDRLAKREARHSNAAQTETTDESSQNSNIAFKKGKKSLLFEVPHDATGHGDASGSNGGPETNGQVKVEPQKADVFVYRPRSGSNHLTEVPSPKIGNGQPDTRRVIFANASGKGPMQPIIPWF